MGIIDLITNTRWPITEKELKRQSFHFEMIKGYVVYFHKEETAGYWDHNRLTACAYRNGRFIVHHEGLRKKGLPLDEEVIQRMREGIGSLIFTEEEILAPNPSFTEYRRKKEFLERLYIKQVEHLLLSDVRHHETYAQMDAMVFDPVSSCLVEANQKDFVEHHIWLYQELQKRFRPTIFPVDAELNLTAQVFVYVHTLSLADPEDPFLPEAKEYLKKNGAREAKDMYEYGSRDTALKLVMGGFVGKPTMKKLLEMANKRKDAEFAAILLDKMQGKAASASRFTL